MKIFRHFIRIYLIICYLGRKVSGTGPFGSQRAVYIKDDFKMNKNRLKKSLKENHVKQFNEASCSVASIVSVINAIKEINNKNETAKLTQHKILEDVKAHKWKKRMSPGGDNGKRGLPLEILGNVIRDSLETYKIEYEFVDVVKADKKGRDETEFKNKLKERLLSFEKKGDSIILIHFNQGVYVKTIGLPHISPVGGYDEKSGNVMILDVDPEQIPPYEISFERFYEGLKNNYNNMFKPFGYDCGGYVYIKL